MIRFPTAPNVSADLVGLFREGLRLSRLTAGESAIVYADTFSNPQYPAAFLAAAKDLGAEAFQIIQPVIPHDLSKGVGRAKPTALMSRVMQEANFVVDVTTGGMLYSDEQTAILAAGTRILRVREPDDCLLRLLPSEAVKGRTIRGQNRLKAARRLRVTSADGTDLTMDKADRPVPIQYGMADEPGRWDHWPTGMVNTTVVEDSVEGRLVIGPASLLFPFERYVADPIVMEFSGGVAVSIEGGREAVMLSDMIDQRNERNCRRLAHIGWGTDHRARWEVLANRGADGGGGAEARSLYGGILIALGENRDLGGANPAPVHIDIALRRARLELDGVAVAENGRILDPTLA
jgi:2,5-dihydroxypyridine 5,6-dioxygenase